MNEGVKMDGVVGVKVWGERAHVETLLAETGILPIRVEHALNCPGGIGPPPPIRFDLLEVSLVDRRARRVRASRRPGARAVDPKEVGGFGHRKGDCRHNAEAMRYANATDDRI